MHHSHEDNNLAQLSMEDQMNLLESSRFNPTQSNNAEYN